jgi:hypothetical protein
MLVWLMKAKRTPHDHPAACPSTSPSSQMALAPSSVAEFNELVSRFNDEHRREIVSCGFGSFSRGIDLVSVDKPFVLWIISKADAMHRCLRLKSEVRLDLFHEFVGTVFGLPVLGSDIWDPSLNKSASSFDHVANTISLSDDKEPPSAAAYRVLDSMSKLPSGEDFDHPKFRVSFLVYLLRILTDDDSPDICESTNFWPALASGRDLGTFNWASFFLECVINTCAAVRRVVRSKKEPYVPAGVALFLKVMLIIIASRREHILVCIRYSACIFFTNMDF